MKRITLVVAMIALGLVASTVEAGCLRVRLGKFGSRARNVLKVVLPPYGR